jgi:hypothetical protein
MTRSTEKKYTHWKCKDDCGFKYAAPIPVFAVAHNCAKKKANVDCVPNLLSENPCNPPDSPVASPMSNEDIEANNTSREETPMATKRAEPAVKASKTTKAPAKNTKPAEASTEKRGRRSFGGRGWLAVEIDKILRKTPESVVTVGEIVKKITNAEGEHPSTGAVAACIARWGEQGYIKVKHERPMSFTGFTAKWKGSTLEAFLEAEKAKRAKARAAAKAA